MSLLPLTFQLSSGTNQEFEDDNSSSRLGGGTAEGGAPRTAPGGPRGAPCAGGFSPALWPPRLPSASPGGPCPPGWDSQTNPGLALCLIRVLIHFTFCHKHFTSSLGQRHRRANSHEGRLTYASRNSSFCEADPALETFPRCSALTREALPHAFLRPSAALPRASLQADRLTGDFRTPRGTHVGPNDLRRSS